MRETKAKVDAAGPLGLQGKKYWTRVPLVDTSGTGDDLSSDTVRTCEQSTFVAVAVVGPRRQ